MAGLQSRDYRGDTGLIDSQLSKLRESARKQGDNPLPSKNKSTEPALSGEDAIRQRAYLLWEADGRRDGMAEHYWLRAASEVNGNGAKKAAKPKARS